MGFIGKTINKIFGGAEGNEGSASMQTAVRALEGVGIPTVEAQRIVLETPELVGQIVPEFEQYEQLTGTKLADIQIPEQLKTAGLQALSSLQEIVDAGGLTPEDEAELNKIRRGVAGEAESRDSRIIQQLQERGIGGSGIELAQRLASNQSAQQTAAEMADRAAAEAFSRKMGAIEKVGTLGSQLRAQEYGEQSDLARAKDTIEAFNLSQRAQTSQRNIDRSNQAQIANLAAKQAQADEATRLKNLQEQYNKQLIQQNFQNQVQKAGGVAQGYQDMAKIEQQQAANKQAGVGQSLGAIGTIGGAVLGGYYGGPTGAAAGAKAGSYLSDKNMKENIQKGDKSIEEMLDELQAYEYDYKPETGIPGRHAGVMAQDLEKSDLGNEFVEDGKMGKMVDYQKAAPVMMAALADGHKRLKKLEAMFGVKEDE